MNRESFSHQNFCNQNQHFWVILKMVYFWNCFARRFYGFKLFAFSIAYYYSWWNSASFDMSHYILYLRKNIVWFISTNSHSVLVIAWTITAQVMSISYTTIILWNVDSAHFDEITLSDPNRCESLGPGPFVPGHKDPGFVLQYLWNEAINHIAVFSPNNVILKGIRYNIQRYDW